MESEWYGCVGFQVLEVGLAMQHVNALLRAALMAPCARIVLSNAVYKPASAEIIQAACFFQDQGEE